LGSSDVVAVKTYGQADADPAVKRSDVAISKSFSELFSEISSNSISPVLN